MSKNDYLMRSLLFVPGHNEKLMNSSVKLDVDILLFDLEDSVQPVSNKDLARKLIVEFINDDKVNNQKVFPRINDRESGELLNDLNSLCIEGVDGFMYPKSKDGNDIYFIDKLLETYEYQNGYEIGKFKLIPLIETASAVLNAEEICRASERVIAIAFGSEDFVGDLEGIHDLESKSLYTPRSIIAMAARSAGVIPIDTVHIRIHDLEDLEENLKISKILGFDGMLCLHPKEIDLVHKYYSPSKTDYVNAKEIVELQARAVSEGRGVAIYDGKFIGPPILLAAQKTIEKYERINNKYSDEKNK